MGPVIRPPSHDETVLVSRRAGLNRTRRLHAGTLNIFAPEEPQAPVASRPALQAYHNNESHETREFSYMHLRRLQPPSRPETPRGIHHVANAAGKLQSIQVVGVTDAYKDPQNIPLPRSGLRCQSRSHSVSTRDLLSYSEADGKGGVRPKGRSASRIVNYTLQERFCQAVRDHAQHRRGGVTGFYVNLVRGCVGLVSADTPVKTATPRAWSLEDEPARRTLTLGNCRDQLQSLTGIPISVEELSELLWGKQGHTEMMDGIVENDGLRELKVSYRDFSAAFGDNSADTKLAVMKI